MINIVIILYLLCMTFLIFKTNKNKFDILGVISVWLAILLSFIFKVL